VAAENVTVTSNEANIPVGFDKDIIQAIRYDAVLQKTVHMQPWNKSMGQTIVVNRGSNWEKQTKYPNTNVTFNAYSQTSEFLFIDTFEVSALQLEDFAELFIPDALLADQVKSMGYALSRGVEVAIANLFAGISQTAPGAALGSEITQQVLNAANTQIRLGGVKPDTESVFLAISPQQTAAFKNMETWTSSLYAGQTGNNNFEKATLAQSTSLGATIVESMLLQAPSAVSHYMALYSQDAFAIAFAQKPEMKTQWRGLPLAEVKVMKQAYGLKRSFRSAETPGSVSVVDTWASALPGV
jgi:hypothetical protein